MNTYLAYHPLKVLTAATLKAKTIIRITSFYEEVEVEVIQSSSVIEAVVVEEALDINIPQAISNINPIM